MSQPDDKSQEALNRLQKRLDSFDGQRASKPADERSIGDGYRLLGEVTGGVLGGLGLGWVVDQFAHTTPFGVIGGLLLGTAASGFAIRAAADRQSRRDNAPATDDRDRG